METTENKQTETHDEMWNTWEQEHRRGKILGGFVLVIIGSLFLAQELGVEFPSWLFSWKILLIVIGLFAGIKHKFRNRGWLIPIFVGTAFLLSDLFPQFAIRPMLWPILIIALGIFIILKPRKSRHQHWERWRKHHHRHHRRHPYFNLPDYDEYKTSSTTEDHIDFTSFMGGIKKNIVTKNFKSGDITVVFAGTELNFSQADFNETASIEITAVFGGVKLVVPANWEIKSELVCVLGGVEDKRAIQPTVINDNKKLLVLRGTVFLGGIEINNY